MWQWGGTATVLPPRFPFHASKNLCLLGFCLSDVTSGTRRLVCALRLNGSAAPLSAAAVMLSPGAGPQGTFFSPLYLWNARIKTLLDMKWTPSLNGPLGLSPFLSLGAGGGSTHVGPAAWVMLSNQLPLTSLPPSVFVLFIYFSKLHVHQPTSGHNMHFCHHGNKK